MAAASRSNGLGSLQRLTNETGMRLESARERQLAGLSAK
jgi:hypothetical protein